MSTTGYSLARTQTMATYLNMMESRVNTTIEQLDAVVVKVAQEQPTTKG